MADLELNREALQQRTAQSFLVLFSFKGRAHAKGRILAAHTQIHGGQDPRRGLPSGAAIGPM
jgi:hypothetical protein